MTFPKILKWKILLKKNLGTEKHGEIACLIKLDELYVTKY